MGSMLTTHNEPRNNTDYQVQERMYEMNLEEYSFSHAARMCSAELTSCVTGTWYDRTF